MPQQTGQEPTIRVVDAETLACQAYETPVAVC